jgi:hypothetical protein
MPTYDEVRSKHKPTTLTVEIIGDSDVARRLNEAEAKQADARNRLELDPSDVRARRDGDDADAELDALSSEIDACLWRFTLRTVGRDRYESLRLANLPTTEQVERARAEGNPNLNHNPETFPPALIGESILNVTAGGETVEPFGVDEAKILWGDEDWSQAELLSLFGAAMSVNEARRVSLGNASRPTSNSGGGSRTASRTGSRSRRS